MHSDLDDPPPPSSPLHTPLNLIQYNMASPPHLVVHGSERGARFKRVGGFLKLCRSQFTVKPHPIIIDLILIEPDRFFFFFYSRGVPTNLISLVSKRRISIRSFFFINSIFLLCFFVSPSNEE